MPIQATKDDVVLSGHGAVDVGTGETAVPGGFELMVYAAGKMAPNYVLYPPTGLVLKPGVPHMLGVAKATPLSELWVRIKTFSRTGQVTRCFWCACAAIAGATNPTVD